MADETKPASETEPTQTATTAETPAEKKLFTQEEVNEIVSHRLSKDRKSRGKDPEPRTAPKDEASKPPPSADEVAELRAEIARERADRQFAEALSTIKDAAAYNKRQREALRREFDPEHPEALKTIADELFGKAADSPPKDAKQPAPVAASAVPGVPEGLAAQYQAPGAPAGKVGEVSPNPFQWTKDDIAAMQRNGTFLKRLEEYRLRTEGGPEVFRRKVPGA